MAGPVSWNFTIDDTSPILSYSPYADGHELSKGWQTWYTGSGYNAQTGETTSGDSFHLTSLDGAQVSLIFYGIGIALYGTTNSSYEVVLDNSTIARPTTDQGVFFSQSGLDAGFHNVTLVAKPTSDQQVLSFRQAIVTSIADSNSSSPSILTYDNQNTTAITYTGNWTPDKVVSGVPSSSSSAPFHTTSDFGTSASLNFSGRTVAVYGSTTFGHGQYSVTLDGKATVLNGSSNWLIGNLLLFYEDGLNETVPHFLNITNLGDNEVFSLNRVDVTQFASASSVSAPSQSHVSVGAIVGPIVAAITILSVLSLYFYSRYRSRHRPKETGHSMFSSSILLPRWLRRGDGRLTPFAVTLDRPQTAQSFTSSDANAYFSGYGYADRAKSPRRSRTPSTNFDASYDFDRPDSILAPPTHVPTIYPSDSASHHQGDEITYPPRVLPNPRAVGSETPIRDESALVDRILELVVQRIDGPSPAHAQNVVRNMTNDSLSQLPAYPEDV